MAGNQGMTFVAYESKTDLMAVLAKRVASELQIATSVLGRAVLSVPGGSTPAPMFDQLCQADLAWDQVKVMLGDERWVPLESDRSNTAMIKKHLLVRKAESAHYVPLYNGAETAQEGAIGVAATIEDTLPLTVAVLGMGTDMHTASIFPGAPERAAAQADDAPAVVTMTPGDGLEDRITLSARALLSAARIHVLIVGDDKKVAYEQALNTPIAQAPIAQFLPRATVHWAPK